MCISLTLVVMSAFFSELKSENTFVRYCLNSEAVVREGYSLQLLCSSSEAIVSYTIANFADIAGLILTCNDTVVDLKAEDELYFPERIDVGTDYFRPVNLSNIPLSPGAECVAAGCVETLNFDEILFLNASCTIPGDCMWLPWGNWSECFCENETQFSCREQIAAVSGGLPCVGNSTKNRHCNCSDLEGNCAWYEWSTWSPCNSPCDNTTRHRHRKLVSAQHNEDQCVGERTQSELCECKRSPGITSYLIPLAVVFLVLVVSGFLCKLVQVYRSDKRYWMLRHRVYRPKNAQVLDINFHPVISIESAVVHSQSTETLLNALYCHELVTLQESDIPNHQNGYIATTESGRGNNEVSSDELTSSQIHDTTVGVLEPNDQSDCSKESNRLSILVVGSKPKETSSENNSAVFGHTESSIAQSSSLIGNSSMFLQPRFDGYVCEKDAFDEQPRQLLLISETSMFSAKDRYVCDRSELHEQSTTCDNVVTETLLCSNRSADPHEPSCEYEETVFKDGYISNIELDNFIR